MEEEDIVAPPLFFAEVTSVVRERAYRGEFSADEAAGFLSESLAWPISVLDDKTILQPRALDFATRFNRPKAYDAQYLAVADLLACELWTADRRLANMVANDLPWVRFVGEAA